MGEPISDPHRFWAGVMMNLPWKKVIKVMVLTIGILLLILLGLSFFLWYQLQEESFQKKVAQAIEGRLPHPFNHKVEIGKVGGRLPGSILVSDVELELPSGDQILLKRLVLNWDWVELFSRRIVLNRFNVESLHLTFNQSQDGTWLPDLQSDQPPAPPLVDEVDSDEKLVLPELDILLEEIAIEDFKVSAISGNASWQNLGFSLPHLLLKGELNLSPDKLTGDLSLSQEILLRLDSHPQLEVKLKAEINFNDEDWGLSIAPLTLETPKSRVQMELFMKDPTPLPKRLSDLDQWLEVGELGMELKTLKLSEGEVKPLLEAELELQDILAQGNLHYLPGLFSSNLILKTGKNHLGLVSSAKVDPINIDLRNHETQIDYRVFLNDWADEIGGEIFGKTHLSGSLQEMALNLSLELKELKAPETIFEKLDLNFKTDLAIKGLMQEAIPSLPVITGNTQTLADEWKAMNRWFDQHQSWMPVPTLELKVSGLKPSPPLSQIDLIFKPVSEALSFKIMGKSTSGNDLLALDLGLMANSEEMSLEINELRVEPEIGLPPLPLFDRAISLDKPSRLVLNRENANIKLGEIELMASSPFIQLEGDFNLLEQELGVQLKLLEQETSAFLPVELDLPLSDPGKVSGLINATGNLPWPKATVEISLSKMGIAQSGSNLSLNIAEAGLNGVFDPEKESVDLKLGLTTVEGLPLKILSHLPLDLHGIDGPKPSGNITYEVDVGATKALDLSIFQPLLPEELSGLKGEFSLGIKGELNPEEPQALDLNGGIHLKKGALTMSEPPLVLDDIELAVGLKPNAISIEHLKMKQGDGRLELTGRLLPSDPKGWLDPRWNLDLLMESWPTLYPPLLRRGELESNLSIAGNLSRQKVGGKIKFLDLLLYPADSPVSPAAQAGRDPNIVFQDEIKSWSDFDREEKESIPPPDFLKSLDLNLAIEFGQNNWIRHDMFRGELVGNLDVKSALGSSDIVPKGALFLRRAELDFQGNRFNMDQGEVTFVGELIPSVDMTFVTEVKTWSIEVILQASVATEITPELRSTPWLSNSDIISVLLLGKPVHAASEDEDNGNMAQDLAAAQGAAIVGQKLGLAEKGIDLEDVSSTGGRIRLGRYIHPRVYVSAAKSVGEEKGHQLSIEYLIRKAFKIRTLREEDEPLGFEIEWGKDY
jgi:hypothetical protein